MTADEAPAQPAAEAPAKESRKERKQREKLERKLAEQRRHDDKMARYRQLRANVRRRRAAYVLLLLLGIAVLVATVWDMTFNAADLKWPLLACYVVLLILCILALISRRRHLEEVNELAELRRVFLEDPGTGDIFELGSSKLEALQGMELSSPTTGAFYKVPNLNAQPIERNFPAGTPIPRRFQQDGIDVEVATYGTEPRNVQFRKPAAEPAEPKAA